MARKKEQEWGGGKGEREKDYLQRSTIRQTANITTEVMKTRRQEIHIFDVLEESNCQLRILSPVKFSLKNEGKNMIVLEKLKLKEFITSKSDEKSVIQKTWTWLRNLSKGHIPNNPSNKYKVHIFFPSRHRTFVKSYHIPDN